jgi:hypothetical protein
LIRQDKKPAITTIIKLMKNIILKPSYYLTVSTRTAQIRLEAAVADYIIEYTYGPLLIPNC